MIELGEETAVVPPVVEAEVEERAVEALREALGDRLVSIVLFGSRARGDARPESDWDLLVLANGLPNAVLERQKSLQRVLPLSRDGGISVLAKTPDEFESRLPALYLDIALDGRVLYDRSGFARSRLGTLRKLIQDAGLYRERTPDGDIWRWKQPPTGRWALEWPETAR